MSVPPKVPEKEPRYKIVELKLTGKPPRQVVFDFTADYFALIESSPDLNTDNVRIAFNEPNNYIKLSKATLVRAPLPVLKSVWVDWDPSENGKYVKFYYSGAPFLEIGANVITLGADFIGVAKEGTLQQIKHNLDKFQFTPDGFLKVTAVSAEIPNIDVALSTRASESTLSAIKSQTDKLTPVLKASIFNTVVTANTNILSSNISPTYSPTTFRIYATFNTQGILSIVRTRGTTTVTEQLNGGYTLNANAAYAFDVVVEQGETINLQYSANATALVLKILEISGVIA